MYGAVFRRNGSSSFPTPHPFFSSPLKTNSSLPPPLPHEPPGDLHWVPVASLPDANFSAHRPPAPGCPPPPALCRLEHVFDEILVLSLPRFAGRTARILAQLRALGAPFTLIHAHDARSVGFLALKMDKSTMALLMTHVAIAEYIRRSPFRHVLLFEDDATLANDFPPAFDAVARALPPDWSFLQLGQSILLKGGDPACLPSGPLILRKAATCIDAYWGLFAVAFSRGALEVLRRTILGSKRSADKDQFEALVQAFPSGSFFTWPPLVAMNPFYGSTLGHSWPESPADWLRTNGVATGRFDLRGPGYREGGGVSVPAIAPSQCLAQHAQQRGIEVGLGRDILWVKMKDRGRKGADDAAVSSRHESELACCVACTQSFPVCVAWAYHIQKQACSLKWSDGGLSLHDAAVVSGLVQPSLQ